MARIDVPFVVEKQRITQPTEVVLVSGGQNYFYATFTLCDTWEDISDIRAVFYRGKSAVLMSLYDSGNGLECKIPWEVMADKGAFEVGIFGDDRLLTDLAYVKVAQGCVTEGNEPEPPTPDWFSEIEKMIRDLSSAEVDEEQIKEIVTNELEIAKESGEFDGKDGYTPQRGVDYWNADDKAEITDYIDDKTALLQSDIEGIQEDIQNEAHFRGYVSTNAKIQALEATPNDYAYSAESGTVWVYDAVDGWHETTETVPDQMTPASDATPLVNGEATAGVLAEYARGDHRHPTDKSRASVEDLNNLKSDISTALDHIIAIQNALIGGGSE